MIKSIAGLLCFLFVISSCYHLVFWSRFNIDVFQYIAIEDIIKGVLYSMSSAILLAGITFILVIAALIFEVLKIDLSIPKAYFVNKEVQLLRFIIITMFIFIMIPSSIIHSTVYELHGHLSESLLSVISYTLPFFSLVFAISTYRLTNIYFNNKNSSPNNQSKEHWLTKTIKSTKAIVYDDVKKREDYSYSNFIQYASIGVFFYFLTSAITLGILNSEKIIKYTNYNYVTGIKHSLIPGKPNKVVVYLGAISSRLIFSDTLTRSYFAISRDSIPSLYVHHMDAFIRYANLAQTPCDSILSKQRASR